jgi:hypothetical protein
MALWDVDNRLLELKVQCPVEVNTAASGWYVLEGKGDSVSIFAGGYEVPSATAGGFPTDPDSDFARRGMDGRDAYTLAATSGGFVERKVKQNALSCTAEADCVKKCRLALHSNADLYVDSVPEGGIAVSVPLSDLETYNDWKRLDGSAMGKFSIHNQLEPRHRAYYMATHSGVVKLAKMEQHSTDMKNMFESHMVSINHLLYEPTLDNRIVYPMVRGLSHTFRAQDLCTVLSMANLPVTPTVLGSSMDELGSGSWWHFHRRFSGINVPGLADGLSETGIFQQQAIALTRRWGRVRCDPLDNKQILLTPGCDHLSLFNSVSQSMGAARGVIGSLPMACRTLSAVQVPQEMLFYPTCQYAVDSTNSFLAAMQLQFSVVEDGGQVGNALFIKCEQFWWNICGGGSHSMPSGSQWAGLPSHVTTIMDSAERECLCTAHTDMKADDWDYSMVTAVRSCWRMDCGEGNPTHGNMCPPMLVKAACAIFKCGTNPDEDLSISTWDASMCGYYQKTPTQKTGGYMFPTSEEYMPPCSSEFDFAPAETLPIELKHIDGLWQMTDPGDSRPLGKCELDMMWHHQDADAEARNSNYNIGALVESTGVLGYHLAVVLVPPFGFSTTHNGQMTDPAYTCVTDFQSWVRRVKTNYNGYFYHPTSAEVESVTAGQIHKWSRSPKDLGPAARIFDGLSFKAWRSAFGTETERPVPTSAPSSKWCAGSFVRLLDSGMRCGSPLPYVGGTGTVDVGTIVPTSTSAGENENFFMRRIKDTCMCAYRWGVDCPLYFESIDRTDSLVYEAAHSTSVAPCCAILKTDAVGDRLAQNLLSLESIIGTFTKDHVYELLAIGFQDCYFSEEARQVSVGDLADNYGAGAGATSWINTFGYPCPLPIVDVNHPEGPSMTCGYPRYVGNNKIAGTDECLPFPWLPPTADGSSVRINHAAVKVYKEWKNKIMDDSSGGVGVRTLSGSGGSGGYGALQTEGFF